MRELDFTSILVAGVIGAVALVLISNLFPPATPSTTASTAGTGFAVGALVQIGVRLTGVS
jgi:hypothetical protein